MTAYPVLSKKFLISLNEPARGWADPAQEWGHRGHRSSVAARGHPFLCFSLILHLSDRFLVRNLASTPCSLCTSVYRCPAALSPAAPSSGRRSRYGWPQTALSSPQRSSGSSMTSLGRRQGERGSRRIRTLDKRQATADCRKRTKASSQDTPLDLECRVQDPSLLGAAIVQDGVHLGYNYP